MEVDATDTSLIKEKVNYRIGHSRSISTGRIGTSPNWKVKLVPSRYLETRFGSCHDLCKHGKELPGEEKVKGRTSRRISGIPEVGDKKLVIDDLLIPINKDKSCPADESDASFQHDKEMEASLGFSGDHEAKPVTDEKNECFQHSNATEGFPDLVKNQEVKSVSGNSFSTPIPGFPSDGRDPETRTAVPFTRIGSSRSKVSLRTPRLKSTAYKGKVLVPTTDPDSPRTPRPNPTRISAAGKGKDALPSSTESAPGNAKNKIMGAIQDGVYGSDSSDVKGRGSRRGRIASRLPPLLGHKKSRSLRGSTFLTKSPTSSGNGNRKVSNSGKSVSSNSSSAASSSRPSTSVSNGDSKEKTSKRRTTRKGNTVTGSITAAKSRPGGAGMLNSEDRPYSTRKVLQFRRGKLVDPKPEKVTAPRRLKFRQARTIGETQHGTSDTARKSSKKIEADALEKKNSTRERVVLRHRNLERAKNVQSLFNNVIEETASKLVKSRKSKVKALVGAFETVILLQDSKPRATIRSR